MKNWKCRLSLLIAVALICQVFAVSIVSAKEDQTTRYRVYQNDSSLKEFSSRNQAIAYAKYFSNSYVEDLKTRRWLWSSFPTYQVIVQGVPLNKVYATYEQALATAKTQKDAIIKNLQKPGILWDNYADYQVYQGDKTLPQWSFDDFDAARQEAKKWGNAHIIKLKTNQWVWDNLTDKQRQQFRNQAPVYELRFQTSTETKRFSFLQDAIREALKHDESTILNTATGQQVYANSKPFVVKQSGREINQFAHLEMAIRYAKGYVNTSIEFDNREVWTIMPHYQVYQKDRHVQSFHTIDSAVSYALGLARSKVVDRQGETLWDNTLRLKVWAWNGTASDSAIKAQVEQATALDVDAPTWFKLTDAKGNIEDLSSPSLVKWLHGRGIEVHPLVHNQFDSQLTSKFLADSDAQKHFIRTLVDKSAELGVDGINMDFEAVSASDRSAYTAFMKQLVTYAHSKGLEVSIDLPRGSAAWNHKTAYDHEALAQFMDTIIIMAYDQHWKGSTVPGPVAGIKWVEQGVQEFLSYGMTRDQLVLGMPFYIREWKLDGNGKLVGNRALYAAAVETLLKENAYTSEWDETNGHHKIKYVKDGYTYVFWKEDQNSLTSRLDLAQEYRLGGVAAWRLGQEPSNFWETILTEK
ncbi:glycosyl hydrolase family 18 protein [Marinicrinis sediminis]|uniref:Glycosyl hydrolase family 18 protein n=1 Tax=Marinicrinis sediminis TaxID=1652465 RepID=A0ABW5RE64_9BACL